MSILLGFVLYMITRVTSGEPEVLFGRVVALQPETKFDTKRTIYFEAKFGQECFYYAVLLLCCTSIMLYFYYAVLLSGFKS
jgi:hypothetical protein